MRNIGQITKAMEVVSATRMRKAQGRALDSRPYAFAALTALSDLLAYAPEHLLERSALVSPRPVRNILLVLVASDRGLAGSFNAGIMRSADTYISQLEKSETRFPIKLMLVGKKLSGWASRSGREVVNMFTNFGDYATPEEIAPLGEMIVDGYISGAWDKVVVISTHFKTTLAQFTVTREVLPMHIDGVRETVREVVPEHGRFSELRNKVINGNDKEKLTEYIFEPSPGAVLDSLLPHLLNMQLLHLVLEAGASEHSARMVAMKNASTNAEELSEELSLEYNKARQAAITKEMIEITSAQSAMS